MPRVQTNSSPLINRPVYSCFDSFLLPPRPFIIPDPVQRVTISKRTGDRRFLPGTSLRRRATLISLDLSRFTDCCSSYSFCSPFRQIPQTSASRFALRSNERKFGRNFSATRRQDTTHAPLCSVSVIVQS